MAGANGTTEILDNFKKGKLQILLMTTEFAK
jgi:hypothetical protein